MHNFSMILHTVNIFSYQTKFFIYRKTIPISDFVSKVFYILALYVSKVSFIHEANLNRDKMEFNSFLGQNEAFSF